MKIYVYYHYIYLFIFMYISLYIYTCSLNFLTTKILVGNQVFIVKLFYARCPVLEWNWNWNHSFMQPWRLGEFSSASPTVRCQAMVPPEELAAVWVHKARLFCCWFLSVRFPAAGSDDEFDTENGAVLNKDLGFAWLWEGCAECEATPHQIRIFLWRRKTYT